MKNDEIMKNELARAEKEIKLWKERSKSWNKKVRDVIGNVTLNMYKNINETGEFRFLIKDQLMYLLNSLFDVKPLTPLTEDEDEWNDISKNFGTESKFCYKKYQNKRYPELFKNVYSCGKTEYHDNNRVTCYDPIMDTTFDFGLINKIYDEIFPIEMPYMPGESNACVNVFCFQSDQKNADKSDFDTVVVMDLEREYEEHNDLNVINRFFREPKEGESPTYGGWVEIDIFELKKRIEASAMKNLDLSDLGLDDVYEEACAKKWGI